MAARRARARTTVLAAVLLGLAWWAGRVLGQHRRARKQPGVEPAYTFSVRHPDADQELTA
jgi:hypothetical protein